MLQLCFYTERLAAIQGFEPERMHVLLGSGERQSFRPEEFGAYYRRVRGRLEEFVADPPRPTALPVAHCGICSFKPLCDAYWDSVDHLSRVAGIRSTQIERSTAAGIDTLAGLGSAPIEPSRPGSATRRFEKIREQAELQLSARTPASIPATSSRAAAGHRVRATARALEGDLFFDFEGNPFWDSTGGLEYLWGILDVEHDFTPLHAHDHPSEQLAFETFIDFVHERLERHPNMHVYHYAQYEITALKRLMGRYGTREQELDDLLRRGVFVDLLRVVRNGVRTSRPGYGLKELEAFLQLERRAEVKDGGTSIIVFEEWMRTRDDALLRQIDDYNREDCIATHELRDWLLERRDEVIETYGPLPAAPEQKPPKPTPPEKGERAALRERLLSAGPRADRTAARLPQPGAQTRVVGVLRRVLMTPAELFDDADSISGLQARRRAGAGQAVARIHASRIQPSSRRSARGRTRSTRRRVSRRATSSSTIARRGRSS